MNAISMVSIYKRYKGLWVALKNWENKPEVVASGKTLIETMEKAKKRGYDMPLVTQIPKKVLPIVGPYRVVLK